MPEHDSGEAGRKRMNKKKLPRAVLRTADEMRDSSLRPTADNVIEMVPKTESASADTSASAEVRPP